MNIFGDRVFMIGDLVRYSGRGGSKRTRENVWEILNIKNIGNGRGPIVEVVLIQGIINDSNNHDFGPGYKRNYFLKDLKHLSA